MGEKYSVGGRDMSIPHSDEVKIALWEELEKYGGIGERQDMIEKLAQRFQLTQAEREEKDPTGSKTFDKRVDSAVAQSRIVGWIEPWQESGRAIWKLSSAYFKDNPLFAAKTRGDELNQRFKAIEDAISKFKEFIIGLIPKKDYYGQSDYF